MRYEIDNLNYDEVYEYLRKSRSDDPHLTVEEVLERHEKILDDYARKHLNGSIPEQHIFREVASSETIDGRPEMLRLLRAIESPRIKGILVVEVQRLSRGDLEDAGRLIKLLRYTNTKVITPQMTYDLQNEYDRDIFERELKRGNEYLEYFKKIQARGRLQSVMEGNYVGSVPPYGYDKIFITEGKKKYPTLKEKEEEANVVRMIFDMYVNKNMGCTNICNYLDELGIKPPKGEHWSMQSALGILRNVHYTGKIKWNWRKTVTVVSDQAIIKTRPKAEEYIVCPGKHKGIISEELFAAAQEKYGKNHRAKASTKIRNPLASLLFCRCGRSMTLRIYKDKGDKIKQASRLICDGQKYCNTGSATFEEVIARVCEIMEKHIDDFTVLLQKDDKESILLHSNLIRNLENKLKSLEEKELNQWEKYSENGMPKDIFEKLNEKVVKEKEKVKLELKAAYENMPDPVDYEDKILKFSNALTALKDPDIDAATKNAYLKSIFDRMEYYRERPVRLTKENCKTYNIDPVTLKKATANWYSPPFELDIKLKI